MSPNSVPVFCAGTIPMYGVPSGWIDQVNPFGKEVELPDHAKGKTIMFPAASSKDYTGLHGWYRLSSTDGTNCHGYMMKGVNGDYVYDYYVATSRHSKNNNAPPSHRFQGDADFAVASQQQNVGDILKEDYFL